MLTPVKRPPSLCSFLAQPKQFFQLSSYQSPISSRDKGKVYKTMGYIAHIGNPEISKNKNLCYDVRVQVTKAEYTTIRFMVKGGCPNAKKLRLIKKEEEEKGNHVIVLQKVFKLDNATFFNMESGSKYIFQNNILPFQPTS